MLPSSEVLGKVEQGSGEGGGLERSGEKRLLSQGISWHRVPH